MNDSGRTLIEVLVAMAIASITGIALISIVTLGLRFSRSSQYEDQRVYPVRNAFDLILKDVRLTKEAIAECGPTKGLAFAVHSPNTSEVWILQYHLEADGRLQRTAYKDYACSSKIFSDTIGWQVTEFGLKHDGKGSFTVRIQAESNDDQHTKFVLEQTVLGRVIAQP